MSLILAFAVTLVMIPIVIKTKIIDRPNHRSIHVQETPKAGGIAILLGILAGLIYAGYVPVNLWLTVLIIGAAALGFYDDIKTLGAITKLLLQAVLATATVFLGYSFSIFGNVADQVITVIWIIGFMNAYNLIDGMDGLAGGTAVISTAAFVLLALPGYSTFLLPIIGALQAFLVFNFRPAKIFMGDTGSMLLGYLLALIAVMVQAAAASKILGMIAIVLILYYPIFDTILSIMRRAINNRPILAPDRSHSYNLMVDKLEIGYTATVLIIYLITALVALMGILVYTTSVYVGILSFLALTTVVAITVVRLDFLTESRFEKK